MTIEKHGNKWRIRQKVDGKLHMVTVDHKPTKSEAMTILSENIRKRQPDKHNMTFTEAARLYIESKENILSPSTVQGYEKILKHLPEDLKTAKLGSLTALSVQKTVSGLSVEKSPKTVRNYSSFIMAVLKSAGADISAPLLPQKERKTAYIPTESDVRAIFKLAEGTRWEVPFHLAALGLRRSEICALTVDDLEGDTLHVNKALVPDKDNNYVIKTTKTEDSTRDITVPHLLAEKIRKQGYVFDGLPHTLTNALYRHCDKLGIPRFSVHKLRHFFASYMHHLGFTDKQIQEAGGWKTDHVLKSVYQHAMEMEEAKKKMSRAIAALDFSTVKKTGTD